ncbi:MAG: hypothetical protein K9N36_08785 [Candidatus Marinimicrobia bacterium]|nr:hypothetical protein [Candidatus Neomarinimicrobiota bacterium]
MMHSAAVPRRNSKKQRHTIYALLIGILILIACERTPSDPNNNGNFELGDNSAPVITSVHFMNTLIIGNTLLFDRDYELRCTAVDSDDVSLTYTWIFTSREYDPFVWNIYNDTIVTDTNRVTYHTGNVGDLEISCTVTDPSDKKSGWRKTYRVGSPSELYEPNWQYSRFLVLDTVPPFYVPEGYFLNFSATGYYGLEDPCVTRFGEVSLYQDTLAFANLYKETYSDSCDSATVPLWKFITLFRYRYQIREDTLDLFMDTDSQNVAVFRFVATPVSAGTIDWSRFAVRRDLQGFE